MRGKALLLIGVILSLSNANGPLGTSESIAQEPPPAREEVRLDAQIAPEDTVDSEHAVRGFVWDAVAKRKAVRVAALPPAPAVVNAAAPQTQTQTFPPVIDQLDIQLKHKIIATEVFDLLPDQCHGTLKHFYVRYEKPERRGLAGKSTVIVDGTLPDDEFRAVLVHEMLGHLFELGCLTGTSQAGTSSFRDGSDPVFMDDPSLAFYRISWSDSKTRKQGGKVEDFVSGYAASDPFEDLAESMAYYILSRDAFVERARTNITIATKLKWMETFLPLNPVTANGVAFWNGSVPWDATKLPYTWKGTTTLANR
ncbi:MAG: hypothetical protein PHE68_05210 [Candidatus Peribacteraceae bacterium]|nr:hypothetical protein [Candidatus Peribacteraceae bacterium]MDD5075081.1 hypothetical protein [Candidatus Peribacteraceae bacterium]